MPQSSIVIYETENGQAHIEVKFDRDNLWLSLLQIAELFERDKSVISRHLRNIFDAGELIRDSVVAKNATTAAVADCRKQTRRKRSHGESHY